MREIKIWDLPTRLFHWCLVALFATSWASAEFDYFTVHYYSGYGILTLVLFRLVWGFAGSDTSKLISYVKSPFTVLRYMKSLRERKPGDEIGHNPMGGYAVLALLGFLTAQVGTGLFAQDVDFINSGPLSDMVSFELGNQASDLHHILFDFLLIMVGIHLTAIAFHEGYKREGLVRAMITGWRGYGDKGPTTPPTLVPTSRALFVFILAVLAMAFIVWILPTL
ncbi:cytochrome b/b6 domain-containing protein [Hwanghaeella grinnelliae]|nr:cytochrome b/b6 domain-containing protein [Hwanghaeella grinnelliae]